MSSRSLVLVLLAGTLGVTLTACTTPGTPAAARPGTIAVDASFYPLAYLLTRIGGDHLTVTTLTKPGAEPHDLELSPAQVAAMGSSALVVYESGLQPSVDAAVAEVAQGRSFDVTPAADLTLTSAGDGDNHSVGDGHSDAAHGDAHQGDAHTDDPTGALDPHFWLDPVRYAGVAAALGTTLGQVDPAHAAAYSANAAAVVSDLRSLDQEFAAGLATCRSRQLVTGHAAFGYLALRYHLTQVPISGVSPDAEPDAASMRRIVDTIRHDDVRTVYAETLVSPALANTIAQETGAGVRVLDPVEAITAESAGADYLAVMRANLTTLRLGQECS